MIYSMIAAGSITGMAWYLGDTYADGKGSTWTFIAIGVMTVIALILLLIRVSRAKKQSRMAGSFEEAVKGSAAGWDGGGAAGTDPAEMARLDNLRKQFQKGIDSFREYGKDFYSLPWYVMVGEPGSGKTEAIRHSDLRFPETLQDMLQGTGGTYSMDWWFTNQAVLLDTAGAMLMNPEATKRFEEFLKLLRTYRPDCPVNGIILAIPVDSLLADNAAKLEEKPSAFPSSSASFKRRWMSAFPFISWSQKVTAYRASGNSPMPPGNRPSTAKCWAGRIPRTSTPRSTPRTSGPRCKPSPRGFRPGGLALLADPIPRQAGNRRVDEVDSLYGFPSTILSLEPRLRRYLEIIFQTGTWATLPPFFRGVYFTSAMNEGAALDEQLASALGMSIETLPGGGLFNRDKSVYLRDVFTEKVFRERGLVHTSEGHREGPAAEAGVVLHHRRHSPDAAARRGLAGETEDRPGTAPGTGELAGGQCHLGKWGLPSHRDPARKVRTCRGCPKPVHAGPPPGRAKTPGSGKSWETGTRTT